MEFKGTKNIEKLISFNPYGGDELVDKETNEVIAIVYSDSKDRETNDANALLFSKAPEMLEMLKECIKTIDWCMGNTTPDNDDHTTFFNLCANAKERSEKLIHEATNL